MAYNYPNETFSWNTTNKIFMYLWHPFILQNLKNILRADPELWGCAVLVPKWLTCPEQFFFCTNHYYYFHLSIGPFHCAKFKKILIADPELWGCTIFGTKMAYLSQFFFLEKNINIIFIYLLAPFLGTKWLIFSNENFFRRPVNKLCSFHTCLSACQKPKSDINLLTLAESHFWL